MTIYDRIRIRREQLNMSQQELADKLGYKSRSAINKIESGLRDINQSKIVAFSQALDTTPAYLMGWEEDTAIKKSPSIEEGEKNIAKEIIEGLQEGKAMIAGKGKNGIDTIPVSDEEFKVMKNMLEAMRKARDMDKD